MWFWGYLCKRYNWRPQEKIASHKQLDPERRTDPDNALNRYGVSFDQFINDVENSMSSEVISNPPTALNKNTSNLRRGKQR